MSSMTILRCGNAIRLSGKEAETFLRDTGRSKLPTTVQEYNLAMRDIREMWAFTGTPEGRLLAAICFCDLDERE